MKRNLNIINNFKGIWIPKEILYDNNLNYFEKMLFSLINSLATNEYCYISNEALADLFNREVRTIQRELSKLKKLGYISNVGFTGTHRLLESNLNKDIDSNKKHS